MKLTTPSLLLLSLFTTTAAAQSNTLTPVDEAWRDPQLVLTRHEIIRAAIAKDTAALRPNLDTIFLSSFGGDGGIDEFFEGLGEGSDKWAAIVDVLTLGGRMNSAGNFSAPFYWEDRSCVEPSRPSGAYDQAASLFTCDGFELLIVLGANVRVRKDPGGTPINAVTLSYVAKDRRVSERRTADGVEWTPVILPDDSRGWIASRFLRSQIGYRAGFKRGSDGKWRMSMFVAGD